MCKQITLILGILQIFPYFLYIQSTLVVKAWLIKMFLLDSYRCCNKLPHVFSDLKSNKLIILLLWRSEAQNGFYMAKIKMSAEFPSFQKLQRRIHFLQIQLLKAACFPCLLAPSSIFKGSNNITSSNISPPPSFSVSVHASPLTLTLLSPSYKCPCHYIGPAQIIHKNFPIYKSLVILAKSSLPCDIIYSQVGDQNMIIF